MNIIDPSQHPSAYAPGTPQQPAPVDVAAAAGFPPQPAEQFSAPPIVGPQFPPTPNPAPGPAAVAPPSVLDVLAQAGVDPNLLAQAQAIANAQAIPAPAPAPQPQPAPQWAQPQGLPVTAPGFPQMAPQAPVAPQPAPMAPPVYTGVQSFPVAQAQPAPAELLHGPVIGFVSASETCVGGTIHADGILVRTDGVKDSDWQSTAAVPARDETGNVAGGTVATLPPGFNLS